MEKYTQINKWNNGKNFKWNKAQKFKWNKAQKFWLNKAQKFKWNKAQNFKWNKAQKLKKMRKQKLEDDVKLRHLNKITLELSYYYTQIVFWFMYLYSKFDLFLNKVRYSLWFNFFMKVYSLRRSLFLKSSNFYIYFKVKDIYSTKFKYYLSSLFLTFLSRTLFLYSFSEEESFNLKYFTPFRYFHILVASVFIPPKLVSYNRMLNVNRRMLTIKKFKIDILILKNKFLALNRVLSPYRFLFSRFRKKIEKNQKSKFVFSNKVIFNCLRKKKIGKFIPSIKHFNSHIWKMPKNDRGKYLAANLMFLHRKDYIKLLLTRWRFRLFKNKTYFFRAPFVTTRRITAKAFRRDQALKYKKRKVYPIADSAKIL